MKHLLLLVTWQCFPESGIPSSCQNEHLWQDPEPCIRMACHLTVNIFCPLLSLAVQWLRCSCVFIHIHRISRPYWLPCPRDGRRQASEGKFKQAVQEWVSFRIREECLLLGTIYRFLAAFFSFHFSLALRLSQIQSTWDLSNTRIFYFLSEANAKKG